MATIKISGNRRGRQPTGAPRPNPFAATTGVILAGGMGTRLKPVVNDRPKPMASINGRPFLDYQIAQLAEAGVAEAILCVGYEAQAIVDALGAVQHGVRLRYLRDWPLRGTGGALRNVLSVANTPTLLVVNGDSYSNADLRQLATRHADNSQAQCTMLLSWRDSREDCGGVAFGDDGQVTSFQEKRADAGPGYVNAGIYVLDRAVLAEIPANRVVSLEREVLPALVGHGLFGWADKAAFIDIGTPDNYRRAHAFLTKDVAL